MPRYDFRMIGKAPKKDVIQDWLERGLAKPGKSVGGLAARLDIAQPRVSELRTGARLLKLSELRPAAEYLEEPIPPELLPPETATRPVPVVSWVSAGSMDGGLDPRETLRTVHLAGLDPRGEWFALEVTGDSMDRISPPGSIIIVNRKERRLVPNGLYVIVDDEGNATYKRYRPNPERFEPVSNNPTHEPIFPTETMHVKGRVRRSILDIM